jgi:hypothetical protein
MKRYDFEIEPECEVPHADMVESPDGEYARWDDVERAILSLESEVNCRWQHGADGAEHLKYVERRLKAIRMPNRMLDVLVGRDPAGTGRETMRKIKQIVIDSQPSTPDWNAYQEMYALCEDGSVWVLPSPSCDERKRAWSRVPGIPEDCPPNAPAHLRAGREAGGS